MNLSELNARKYVNYRLYACGNLVSEDEFDMCDNMQPYYDDFYQTEVPASIDDIDAIPLTLTLKCLE